MRMAHASYFGNILCPNDCCVYMHTLLMFAVNPSNMTTVPLSLSLASRLSFIHYQYVNKNYFFSLCICLFMSYKLLDLVWFVDKVIPL